MRAERNINYRSFEPIFRLAAERENPICQRWSCWALANLTTVYPETYCPLFEKENGRVVIEGLLADPSVGPVIKNYCSIVMANVNARRALENTSRNAS